MRISDWSSDVCSSDLTIDPTGRLTHPPAQIGCKAIVSLDHQGPQTTQHHRRERQHLARGIIERGNSQSPGACQCGRSEEHTSELQSLMRISYAVFCLKKKKHQNLD